MYFLGNAALSRHGQAVRQGTRGCRREPEGIRRSFLRKYAPQLVAAKQMDLPLPA